MSTSSNPIVQASEATMTAGGLPPAGTVYEFINTDKNNSLWYIDSNGNFFPIDSISPDDCACRITSKWMCGINDALTSGLMTPGQYQTSLALGLSVNVTGTPDGSGGFHNSIVVGVTQAAVTSVTMNSKITTLSISATHQCTVTLAPINAIPNVLWVSSDVTKATVDGTGLITGIAAGTVTITVYSAYDGTKHDQTTITVS